MKLLQSSRFDVLYIRDGGNVFDFKPKPISAAGESGFGTIILKLSGEYSGNGKVTIILRGSNYIAQVIAKMSFIITYQLMKTRLELGVKEGMRLGQFSSANHCSETILTSVVLMRTFCPLCTVGLSISWQILSKPLEWAPVSVGGVSGDNTDSGVAGRLRTTSREEKAQRKQ